MSEANGESGAASWELLEVLAAVVLAAESLRIVGSVIAGIISGLSSTFDPLGGQRVVGNAMEAAANFSDGPGIVLLLLSLGLLWWRVDYWSARVRRTAAGFDTGAGSELVQVERLRRLSVWAFTLFALASAGAVAYLVGNILVNSVATEASGARWASYADDSFSVAYLVIALGGLVAARRLCRLCDIDMGQLDAVT